MAGNTCWIDGCSDTTVSWGMCQRHRDLWEKLVRTPRTRLVRKTDQEKYDFYTMKNPSEEIQRAFGAKPDCHIWTAGLSTYGYGTFRSDWNKRGGSFFTHVFALVQIAGLALDPDEETDHLCRFRPCSNAAHLERVTQKVNTLRGENFTAVNARKTHCDRNHEFTPENTFVNDLGWRACRTCSRESVREYQSRPEVKEKRLEDYTPKSGVRGKGQYQAQRDKCDEGHKLEGDNLIQEKRTRNGKVSYVRRCRTCTRAKQRDNHAKRVQDK